MESLLVVRKWGGDADITSPFFAAPLLRCRDLSLLVVPSSFAGFLISWGALHWRNRLYSDTVGDSLSMESWSVKGELSSVA
ncbi:MAG: hypothetical protein Nkreftii_001475 [Candidatus Nitrospira kreftii]|uniref:Uncharacterized protein n=1 Tax=Candidatus Nitrospira kreftii TaxID=2652173 RepID=A0A7S8FDB1_9BACT|nr:MAG: hypothetical protein Nkreftii_001475 [Candidatus Nitrospira kreftii]